MIAVYLTVAQIVRYTENGDASKVTFKRFNESSNDRYPTFTFCLVDNTELIYSEATKELLLTSTAYSSLLKGDNFSQSISTENMRSILKVDFAGWELQAYQPDPETN